MSNWLFRAGILLACPAIVYFGRISPDARGLGIGLGVGGLIVLVEYLVAELNLMTIVFGVLGTAVGIIVARLVDYMVLQIGNENLYAAWDRFALLRVEPVALAIAVLVLFERLPVGRRIERVAHLVERIALHGGGAIEQVGAGNGLWAGHELSSGCRGSECV